MKVSKNSWKHIYTFKKRVMDFVQKQTAIKYKQQLVSDLTDILNRYPNNSYVQTFRSLVHLNSNLDTLENMKTFFLGGVINSALSTPIDIKSFLDPFLELRINNISGQLEVNGKCLQLTDDESEEIVMTSIISQLTTIKTTGEKGLIRACEFNPANYLKSGIVPHYNPIKEYYNSLPINSETTEIQKVIELFDSCSLNKAGRNFVDWCFGVIKNALGSNYYDKILYLYSSHGNQGKTYFLQNDLLHKSLHEYISTDFNFSTQDKDDKFKLAENILLIDDEGTSTSRKSDDAKKAISSKRSIKERKSYDRTKTSQKRIASLAICTNQDEISSASNVDRRSLIVHLPNIAWNSSDSFVLKWRAEIDKDLFWSQLHTLFQVDPSFEFVKLQEIIQETNNWKQISPESESISKYLRIPKAGEKYQILTHIEIKKELSKMSRGGDFFAEPETMKVSLNGLLKTAGFENVKMQKCPTTGKHKSGYKVIFIKQDYFHKEFLEEIDLDQSMEDHNEVVKKQVDIWNNKN